MSLRVIKVGYTDRAGTTGVANVIVQRYRYSGLFYATHLGLWGCGKDAFHIGAAIRHLVQDMAIIRWIGKEPEES